MRGEDISGPTRVGDVAKSALAYRLNGIAFLRVLDPARRRFFYERW